jgi:hypothetical protein
MSLDYFPQSFSGESGILPDLLLKGLNTPKDLSILFHPDSHVPLGSQKLK